MRFLHLADLHIGSKLQTGDAELCAQAKEKMWLYLEQLFSNLDSEQIDLCLLAGDVFEPSTLSASELERFIACLKLPKRCYILAVAGNHDPLTASFPWQTVLKQKLTNFHLLIRLSRAFISPIYRQLFLALASPRFIKMRAFCRKLSIVQVFIVCETVIH